MAVNLVKKSMPEQPSADDSLQSIAKTLAAVPTKKVGESAAILAQIRKDKGDKTVIMGSQVPVVQRIPTGMFEFDLAVGGGFPRGRYSIIYGPESSGKSNACYCAAANAQRLPDPCNKVVWVDLEGTYSAEWASMFGINVDELIVVKPSYGEEAADLIDALVRADDVALIVVDSLAVLVASKELEQSFEKFDVGTSAILIKRMCNKLVIALSEESKRGHTPAVVLINQTRNKIGVMFGNPECLHGDTLVNMADGTSKTIREIVNTKHPGPVLAYNEDTHNYEPRAILSHHHNGVAKDGEFLTITSKAIGTKNGVLSATTSVTHKFLTSEGWKAASDLKRGDFLLSRYKDAIQGTLRDFLRGTACGDLTLAPLNAASGGQNTCFRIEDSVNPEYAAWKVSKLSPFFNFAERPNDSGSVCYVSSPRADIAKFREAVNVRDPHSFLANFTWLGMALWYMDDGSIHHASNQFPADGCSLAIGRARHDAILRAGISEGLFAQGLDHEWTDHNKAVRFTSASTVRLHSYIAQFVPDCMQYKLISAYKGKYVDFDLDTVSTWVPHKVEITSVVPSSPRKYRNRNYYDIEVEGLSNYCVGNLDNGFVVHNTMPGGQTMKFLSSLTIRVSGKNKMDKAIHPDLPVFKETSATIVKAKVPVTGYHIEYDMVVYPHDGLEVGQTASWNKVSSDLKQLGFLTKVPKGWSLGGMEMPTLVAFQDTYYAEPEFAAKLQKMILDSNKGKMFLIAATDAAK